MSEHQASEETILEKALSFASTEAREAYLQGACGDDEPLRSRVGSLIEAHLAAGGFLPNKPLQEMRTVIVGPSAEEGPGTLIGRYKLLQLIGEGGMGLVYMAEQQEPVRRQVALKVIKLGMDTRSVVARFEAERQALATMDHPNIAKIFDAGVTDSGRPYFVMELVRGVPITEYCDRNHLPARNRLQLFVTVCEAIQHAHHKGIIHRDIKPSNVLVTLNDGVPHPMVIDFGIAKATNQRLTEKTLFTNFGTMIGTPAYMSPEQAEMSKLDVDTRSDLYSLGVLLYELLTSTTPFPSKELLSLGYGEMQRVILEREPPRPSTRLSTMQNEERTVVAKNRGIEITALTRMFQGDLDWVVMKCLEKDRSRRYETANGLAMDIVRYLATEPVMARPPSATYRLQKAIRRNRGFFVGAAVVFVALLAGISISAWQASVAKRASRRATLAELATAQEARLAKQERDRALAAQAEADRHARQARRYSYVANLNLAAQAQLGGNPAKVRALLAEHVPPAGQEETRDFEWRYLWKQSRNESASTLILPRIPVCGGMFTPDGTKLIVAQLYDQVRVFERATLRTIGTFSTNALDIAVSRDGRTLAVLRTDDQAQIFDAATFQERFMITNLPYWADKILISPNGLMLAIAHASEITLWDTSTGQMKETIPIRRRPVDDRAFAVSPDWSTFLTSDAKSLFLWDRASHSLARELPGHDGGAYSASFSPDGRWFATGGWLDRQLKLWNAESRQTAAIFTNHNGWIGWMEFLPDGTALASCGSDHTIRLWDLKDLKEKTVLRGHADEVWLVSFSPDGRLLLSGDRGGELSLWNLSPPPPELAFLEGNFMTATFSLDGQSFTTISRQGLLQTWDGASLREIRRGPVASGSAKSARISPDGSVLALGMTNGQIQLHNLTNSKLMPVLNHGSRKAVQELEFSADGSRLASSTSLDLRVWDTATGASLYHATNVADPFWGLTPVILSPDGKVLAYATADLNLCLVNLETGAQRKFNPDLWGILMLAFSPDGQYLAGSGRDHRIKIWQSADLHEIATLKAWRQAPSAIAFNRSSRRLAVALDDGGIKLFDLTTTQEVGSLPAEPGMRWVAFSPDGNCVVARYRGGFQFWRAPSWEEIASAELQK